MTKNKVTVSDLAEELNIDIKMSSPTVLGKVAYESIIWVFNTSKKLNTYIDKMKSVAKKDKLTIEEQSLISNHVKMIKGMDRDDAQIAIDAIREFAKTHSGDDEEVNKTISFVLSTEPQAIFSVYEKDNDSVEESSEEALNEFIDNVKKDKKKEEPKKDKKSEESTKFKKDKKIVDDMVINSITGNPMTLRKANKIINSAAFGYIAKVSYEQFRSAESVRELLLIVESNDENVTKKINTYLANMTPKEVDILVSMSEIVRYNGQSYDDMDNNSIRHIELFMTIAKHVSFDEWVTFMSSQVYTSDELQNEIEKLSKENGLSKVIEVIYDMSQDASIVDDYTKAVDAVIDEVKEELDSVVATPADQLDLYNLSSNQINALIKADRVQVGKSYIGTLNSTAYMMKLVTISGFYRFELGEKVSNVSI